MELTEAPPSSARVELFADGACSGNPGPGGWGVLLRCKDREKELSGSAASTTNNRMELTAVIEGLRALLRPCSVVVATDSSYVVKGMTEWLQGWKKKGWKASSKAEVKNVDLWQALEREAKRHCVEWRWVKGHVGHPENERADRLARAAIPKQEKAL